uniref:ATP synthase F0 subunit 8 n=1 Tax=Rhodella violacea TaxID=2801 RepID=UPI001FCDBCE5|nr:ATP synthase F0 subunit 8 [Rhodella violacea]UNJ19083.1 ATP synthase F0 subunit 8 [Rhodella violacea]
MPQLDITLIFNQSFWLILILLTFYILVTYLFLPNIYNIFYLRSLILKVASASNKSGKNSFIFTSSTIVLKNYLNTCSNVFLSVFVKKTLLINKNFIINTELLTKLQINVLKTTSNIILFGVSILSDKPLKLY